LHTQPSARQATDYGSTGEFGFGEDKPYCDLNPRGGGSHFVAVTDVYLENDQWMVRYYDSWVDGLKQTLFEDFTRAAYAFSGGGSYDGFFTY
jgi:hypothetical protein